MLWFRQQAGASCSVATSVCHLAGQVLNHFKPRVIPALPAQHQVQSVSLGRHDDLLEDGPQNPLERLDEAAGWFQSAGRSSASASKIVRSSSLTALGCSQLMLRI
jgi:hypothetical protein